VYFSEFRILGQSIYKNKQKHTNWCNKQYNKFTINFTV